MIKIINNNKIIKNIKYNNKFLEIFLIDLNTLFKFINIFKH